MLYILFRYLLWPLFMIIMRPQVYNLKGLRVKGGAIYACNHLSMLDPVMIAFLSPRIVHFMAKKELFNGLGKVFFKGLMVFPVNRHTADIASLKRAMRFRMIVGEPVSREGLENLSRNEMSDEFTNRLTAAFEGLKARLEDMQ